MKLILDVKDDKALFLLELLKNFPFVSAKEISPYNAEILEGLKDSVEQVNLVKEEKVKLKSAKDLLDEL
ncbi:MAG: hypothetical protein JXR10_04440 [Cyclobacteriaceae bacterium]